MVSSSTAECGSDRVFNMELKGISLQSPRSTDLRIREAVLEDLPTIESLSAAAFTNYPSHYSSNKRFAPEKVTDGYVEWAKNCVTSPDCNVMVATRDNIVCGFIATSVGRDDAEIILNAVDPHVQQQGIYGNLLQAVCSQLNDLGMSYVTISSQITNIRVINAWIKQGFKFSHALNTFHVELTE